MKHLSISIPSHSIPSQLRPMLPPSTGLAQGGARDIRLSDLGNGELPSDGHPAATKDATSAWTAKRMVAASLVVFSGFLAYWTFGRPIFGSVSRQGAGPAAVPAVPGGPKTDWKRVDDLLRKSHG